MSVAAVACARAGNRRRECAPDDRLAVVRAPVALVHDEVARPIRDDLGDEQPAFVHEPGLESLEFTRGGLPNPGGWARSSLQRVAYTLERGTFARIYWRELDRLQGTVPVRRVLLKDVANLAFRFLDDRSEWHEQWPPLRGGSLQESSLPAAVELTLELEGWRELRRVYALPG